jgi:hypothetical protein
MAFRNSMQFGATAPLHPTGRKKNHGDIPSTAALQVSIGIATDDPTGDADAERVSSATQEAVANPVDTQLEPSLGASSDPAAGHDGQPGAEPKPVPISASPARLNNDSDCPPEEEAKARIIYSFQGQASNELAVKVGEIVVVVEKQSHGEFLSGSCVEAVGRGIDVRATIGWWLVRNKQEGLGWVPASFVQELQYGRRSRQKNKDLKGLAWY